MTRRWTLRLSIGVVAAAVALTGCSDKQDASDSLPSASSSATPTEEELPPLGPEDMPMPDEARTQDAAGAEAFVRYYVALTKHVAESSSDARSLVELSQDCATCRRIAAALDADRAAGLQYREYVFRIESFGEALIDGDTAEIGFRYVQGPITVVDHSGQVIADRSAATAEELQSGASLRWMPELQSWVLTSLTVG